MKPTINYKDFYQLESLEYAYERKKADRYLFSNVALLIIGTVIAFGTLASLQQTQIRSKSNHNQPS